MRGNITIRVFAAVAIIAVTYLGMYLVHAGIQVASAELPSWDIQDLPLQLGEGKGEDKQLDERLFKAIGAVKIIDRQYVNSYGMIVSLHFAIFTDPNEGIWHNPISCYESAGWVPVEKEKVQLPDISDGNAVVSLMEWEKSGDRAKICYWYQLGENRLYTRFDLGTVRWKMAGEEKWPALLKILVHTPAGAKTEDGKDQLLGFASLVYQWINQPQHEKNDSPAPETTSPPQQP